MGRLIDADALIEKLKRTSAFGYIRNAADKNVFEIINEQPTAYDVEKVMEQLDKLECHIIGRHYFDNGVEAAMEVVKRGGVDNEYKR